MDFKSMFVYINSFLMKIESFDANKRESAISNA